MKDYVSTPGVTCDRYGLCDGRVPLELSPGTSKSGCAKCNPSRNGIRCGGGGQASGDRPAGRGGMKLDVLDKQAKAVGKRIVKVVAKKACYAETSTNIVIGCVLACCVIAGLREETTESSDEEDDSGYVDSNIEQD